MTFINLNEYLIHATLRSRKVIAFIATGYNVSDAVAKIKANANKDGEIDLGRIYRIETFRVVKKLKRRRDLL